MNTKRPSKKKIPNPQIPKHKNVKQIPENRKGNRPKNTLATKEKMEKREERQKRHHQQQ